MTLTLATPEPRTGSRSTGMELRLDAGRSAGMRLILAMLVGLVLTIPLFSIWLLVYDRKSQSEEATASVTEGWGAAQVIEGPLLVIPYRAFDAETLVQDGHSVTRTNPLMRELILAPRSAELTTELVPELRRRSIYEAVVYEARNSGNARFDFPTDGERAGVDPAQMDLSHAELRFYLSDAKGLGADAEVTLDGRSLPLLPAAGSNAQRGFFAPVDASDMQRHPLTFNFSFALRGNQSLSLAPSAADTHWRVSSSWRSPSFGGGFLPVKRRVGRGGFAATYRIGNLALGRSLVSTGESPSAAQDPHASSAGTPESREAAAISLIEPVDVYSEVNRATKYGFLFIGFTFLALLMFDVIGGVVVSAVEYLLTGAALILFFVLLLAFAELIGFAPAYVLASAAIAGLDTAYSAAVLRSWWRASFMGGLLIGLYAILYVLLSLEAYSLLIGSLLLFVALAAVMYATRRIDWGASRETPSGT